jgi:hypothetical protein
VTDTSPKQFGLIIAYLLPGFIALAGFARLFPLIQRWLLPASISESGIGSPIFAIMAAMTTGLIVSCFRWLLLDQVHHLTGVQRPQWDDTRLDSVLRGFDYLVQNHFRYYEFCGNTLIALLWAYGVNRAIGALSSLGPGTDLGMIVLCLVLFTASRDALAKYYIRTSRILGSAATTGIDGENMFNGNDHGPSGKSSNSGQTEKKPPTEPRTPAEPKPSVVKPGTSQK